MSPSLSFLTLLLARMWQHETKGVKVNVPEPRKAGQPKLKQMHPLGGQHTPGRAGVGVAGRGLLFWVYCISGTSSSERQEQRCSFREKATAVSYLKDSSFVLEEWTWKEA